MFAHSHVCQLYRFGHTVSMSTNKLPTLAFFLVSAESSTIILKEWPSPCPSPLLTLIYMSFRVRGELPLAGKPGLGEEACFQGSFRSRFPVVPRIRWVFYILNLPGALSAHQLHCCHTQPREPYPYPTPGTRIVSVDHHAILS